MTVESIHHHSHPDSQGNPDQTLPLFGKTSDGIITFMLMHSPVHGYVGFPKYIPTDQVTQTYRQGQYYDKFKGYEHWFQNPTDDVAKYLKYVPELGTEVFCFPDTEVDELYHPLNYLQYLTDEQVNSPHIQNTIRAIESLSQFFNVPVHMFGLEGSSLLGTFHGKSDIDLFVYGYQNAQRIAAGMPYLRDYKTSKLLGLRGYNPTDHQNILAMRANLGYGETDKAILEQEMRRLYAFYGDTKISIYPITTPRDRFYHHYNIGHSAMREVDMFEGSVTIVDDTMSVPTPTSLYAESGGKVLRIEMIDPYAVNQARNGEQFTLKGRLYEELDGQLVVALAPWNYDVDQAFHLQTV